MPKALKKNIPRVFNRKRLWVACAARDWTTKLGELRAEDVEDTEAILASGNDEHAVHALALEKSDDTIYIWEVKS